MEGKKEPMESRRKGTRERGGREGVCGLPLSLPLSAVEPNFENVKRQKTDRGHEIAILAAFALGSSCKVNPTL